MRLMSKSWIQAARHYQNPRVLSMILFGISSGAPFLLTLSTMNLWLTQLGISSTTIGQLAFIHLPYALKFLWSPLIDQYNIPILTGLIGKRRSWIFSAQIGLSISIASMSQIDPQTNLILFAICGFLTAFFSATQDLVLGGYRIEVLAPEQQGVGSGSLYIGYRIGILASSSGALYLSSFFPWPTIYILTSFLFIAGTLIVLLNPEPTKRSSQSPTSSYFSIVRDVVKDIISKPQWIFVPIFIMSYKVGDGIFGAYTPVFLSKIGFSNLDISQGHLLGLFFAISGGFIGGILISRYGGIRALIFSAWLQIFTCLILVLQAYMGYSKPTMFLVMAFENFYFGLGNTAFYGFLSLLCTSEHKATQFALLLSFGSFSRIIATWIGGWAADQMPWSAFFFFSSFAGIVYILILQKMKLTISNIENSDPNLTKI